MILNVTKILFLYAIYSKHNSIISGIFKNRLNFKMILFVSVIQNLGLFIVMDKKQVVKPAYQIFYYWNNYLIVYRIKTKMH